VPYLSASAVVIHYEEALYQVYAPLPFYLYYYYSYAVVKVGGNAWERRSPVHHFCNLAFAGLSGRYFFPRERTFPGRRDSFYPRERKVLRRSKLVSLNLVKINGLTRKRLQGPLMKTEGGSQIFTREPMDFYRFRYLKITLFTLLLRSFSCLTVLFSAIVALSAQLDGALARRLSLSCRPVRAPEL